MRGGVISRGSKHSDLTWKLLVVWEVVAYETWTQLEIRLNNRQTVVTNIVFQRISIQNSTFRTANIHTFSTMTVTIF